MPYPHIYIYIWLEGSKNPNVISMLKNSGYHKSFPMISCVKLCNCGQKLWPATLESAWGDILGEQRPKLKTWPAMLKPAWLRPALLCVSRPKPGKAYARECNARSKIITWKGRARSKSETFGTTTASVCFRELVHCGKRAKYWPVTGIRSKFEWSGVKHDLGSRTFKSSKNTGAYLDPA